MEYFWYLVLRLIMVGSSLYNPPPIINENELVILANVVYYEAGNQEEYGQRLVIDCVLNRVDDSRFPDNITDVLYQQGQFDTIYYVDSNLISENIYNLIIDEMQNRSNYEVLYFRNSCYHSFGTPVLQYGAHYFSK